MLFCAWCTSEAGRALPPGVMGSRETDEGRRVLPPGAMGSRETDEGRAIQHLEVKRGMKV